MGHSEQKSVPYGAAASVSSAVTNGGCTGADAIWGKHNILWLGKWKETLKNFQNSTFFGEGNGGIVSEKRIPVEENIFYGGILEGGFPVKNGCNGGYIICHVMLTNVTEFCLYGVKTTEKGGYIGFWVNIINQHNSCKNGCKTAFWAKYLTFRQKML